MSATNDATQEDAQALRQVLTFQLGEELYGIDILQVQEIRGWSAVTRIPQSRAHVLGVLNLRGSIVPILDVRVRFGLPEAAFTPLTVIIVISVMTDSGRRECGLVVDSVSDVVDLAPEAIRPAPELQHNASSAYILSLATIDERMLILLNADDLVSSDLVSVAQSAAA